MAFTKRLKTTVPVKVGTYVGEPERTDIVTWHLDQIRIVITKDFAGIEVTSTYTDSQGNQLERKDKGKTTLNGIDAIQAAESMITLSTIGNIVPKLEADIISVTKIMMAQTFGITVEEITEELLVE